MRGVTTQTKEKVFRVNKINRRIDRKKRERERERGG
jgi:hypothetical protein